MKNNTMMKALLIDFFILTAVFLIASGFAATPDIWVAYLIGYGVLLMPYMIEAIEKFFDSFTRRKK